MFGKKKPTDYIAVFTRKINSIPTEISRKRISLSDTEINFKVKEKDGKINSLTWKIAELTGTLRQGNDILIFCDIDNNGSFLEFEKTEQPISIKQIDALITQNIVVEFLMKIKKSFDKGEFSGKLIGYVIVAIASGACGYIVNETIKQQSLNTARLALMFVGLG